MNFTIGFQLRLLALFYTDKDFYLKNQEYIKDEFFNSLFLQWLLKLLKIYVETNKSLPTRTVVEQYLDEDKNLVILPEEQQLVTEFLALITSGNIVEASYIKENFQKFVKIQTLKIWRSEQESNIDEGNAEEVFSSLRHEVNKFESPTGLLDTNVFSLFNLQEIYDTKAGILTGIEMIDTVVKGLLPKQMFLALSDTNVGKSILLTQIGGKALRQGKEVVHVTLEMSAAWSLLRYYANLAEDEDEIKYDNILNFSPSDAVHTYILNLREKYESKLHLYEFPTGNCSIPDVYRLVDKHPNTDLLIIDYLELMKPPRRRNELRSEHSDITVGLRGLAIQAGIHLASVTQANRQASNRRIIGKELSAEDYGKFRVVDVGIGMGQTKADATKNEVVIFLTKSRTSAKGQAERYFLDFQRMRFKFQGPELVT